MTRITTRHEILAYARAEHATTPAAWPPGTLLASWPRTATRTTARCAICDRAILPGQRIATLTTGDTAHIAECITGLRPGDPGAPAPDPALTAVLQHHSLA